MIRSVKTALERDADVLREYRGLRRAGVTVGLVFMALHRLHAWRAQ